MGFSLQCGRSVPETPLHSCMALALTPVRGLRIWAQFHYVHVRLKTVPNFTTRQLLRHNNKGKKCINYRKKVQSAPGSTVKGGCSGSLIFTVLSAPPLPPVHRVRGGGEVCFQTPRKHRWASSLSSNYSEFFVESGSLRAASPGSPGTWYLLHL